MIKMWSQYGGRIILGGTVVIIIVLIIADKTEKVNQGLAMVIVTTILVATTMYYSLLNQRLLDATDSPKVILDIRPWNTDKEQYVFVIENVGTGIAFDIKIEMLRGQPLMLNSELSLEEVCAKINPIPPKQNYKLSIEAENWEPEKRKTSYDIKVSYKNSRDKKCSKEFSLSIDAIHYYLQGDLVAERLGEIADHTKEIANQSPAPKEITNQSSASRDTGSGAPTPEAQEKQDDLELEAMSKPQRVPPPDKEFST